MYAKLMIDGNKVYEIDDECSECSCTKENKKDIRKSSIMKRNQNHAGKNCR